ncbi:urease accessory protein [Eubacterium aggregans]|uniref:Urease accessory protein UreD n=1 Tax=Eubacterium aggregans TaxID=81409 RepID=A0A1H3WUC5_9FIRM|nr:urease accessory protein UreD [Eubacterium aggregans]SDZ90755.1 urease accessory protein [Eubacterium aggregans]
MRGNAFGKPSTLRLAAACRERWTHIADLDFTAPFKVMQPFYPPSGAMEVMLLTASAGLMEGDRQEIELAVGPEAAMVFKSQAYEKIHRMPGGGQATRRTHITLESHGFLDYSPQPVIPFAQSAFENTLTVDLAPASRFILREVIACGRAARGEAFDYRYFHSHTQVRREGHLIYRDNIRFDPEAFDLAGIGLYEGYTHMGALTLFGIPVDKAALSAFRNQIEAADEIIGGATRLASGDVAIRLLGRRAQGLEVVMGEMVGAVDV